MLKNAYVYGHVEFVNKLTLIRLGLWDCALCMEGSCEIFSTKTPMLALDLEGLAYN
jgi:hypothetical protein